jgi:hypothetical protein
LVRTDRRATGDRPGALIVNRSITEECSSTSGTASSPSGTANAASPAAHSKAFARARVAGAAAITTNRAKAAASPLTDTGRQRVM